MKLAVILFNLGGPDSPQSVEPFLRNLFSDPAIIALPAFLRLPLARWIARKRMTVARKIYAHLGGASPILPETRRQGDALEQVLCAQGWEAKVFVAMRYWHPFSEDTARAAKAFAPDRVVLLPLYPQYSTTTSGSSLQDWQRAARRAGLSAPATRVCCYPWDKGFVAAAVEKIIAAMQGAPTGLSYRLLLSAHGLPRRIVEKGDPYQWQIEQSASAIVETLNRPDLEAVVCYQSRVGPLKWIGPATEAEITRAGREGKAVIVAPIAFVSEHSETLVELDVEYRKVAQQAGVADYRRAAAVGVQSAFIDGLAGLVRQAVEGRTVTCGEGRICPLVHSGCGYGGM